MIKKKKSSASAAGDEPAKKKASVAFTGSKGFDAKPIPTGGSGGGDFVLFRLPQGAEDVPVVILEDEATWLYYHEIKSAGEQYWSRNKFLLSPRDPESPHLPSFIEKRVEKFPQLKEVVGQLRSAAAITVWVPSGVPGKDGKFYQENGIKLLLIPPKMVQTFRKFATRAREKNRTLLGAKFTVSRSEEKQSSAIGTTWLPEGYVKLEGIEAKLKLKRDKWAFDWRKLFVETDLAGFKKLTKQLRSSASVNVKEEAEDDEGTDDIPF